MDAIKALKGRRSIRKYKYEEIDKEIIEEIVDCARLAPSANNIQPWEFVVVKDKEKLKRLSEITDYGFFIKDANVCIIVCCEDTKYYLEDGCAATENILIAAKAFNIGSCWVAGDKKPYLDGIKALLKIPKEFRVVSIISLGYPKGKVEAHGKRELNEVIHWDEF